MKTFMFSLVLLACILAATSARADVLFITGPTSPAAENVLFNQPGLIQIGNTVQGRTELTNFVFNFTFFQGSSALTTTSPGEPRIEIPGFTFNSLLFRFDDPLISFTELDFFVNASQVGPIMFTALTTDGSIFSSDSSLDAPFINPFSVAAINGQRLLEVRYTSPAPFTVDVRRIRLGGIESTAIPEPSTLALLASSLILLVGGVRFMNIRRRSKNDPTAS